MKPYMKELLSHPWDFTLYERKGERIISIVFHKSYVDTSKCFQLDELKGNVNMEQLKKLAEQIRNNYEIYTDQEITPCL